MLVISLDAAEALREIDRDREMSEERRTKFCHKIHAGITGRITKQQTAKIRELRQTSLKLGDIGFVAQPDKERAVLTEGEQARERGAVHFTVASTSIFAARTLVHAESFNRNSDVCDRILA